MTVTNEQAKVLALAVFHIRVLLSGCLGSNNDEKLAVRQAAHLAYALHNEALAIIEGKGFDVDEAIRGLEFSDSMFGSNFSNWFKQVISKVD